MTSTSQCKPPLPASTPPIQPRGEAGYVNIFSALDETLTEAAGLHSPDVCLPVGGWEVFSIDPTPVSTPGTVYGDFNVNCAVIQKGCPSSWPINGSNSAANA